MATILLFEEKGKGKNPIEFQTRMYPIIDALTATARGGEAFATLEIIKANSTLLTGDLAMFSIVFWKMVQVLEQDIWIRCFTPEYYFSSFESEKQRKLQKIEWAIAFSNAKLIAAQLFREFAIEFTELPNLGVKKAAENAAKLEEKKYIKTQIIGTIGSSVEHCVSINPADLFTLEMKQNLITALQGTQLAVSRFQNDTEE